MRTTPLIAAAPPQPWTCLEGPTLLHVESGIEAEASGVPVCSLPKNKHELGRLLMETGSITAIEWRAIYDALAFTAMNSGCVSDAHNRAVDHVCKILGLPAEPNPERTNPMSAIKTFSSNNDFEAVGEPLDEALRDASFDMGTGTEAFLLLRADLSKEAALKAVDNLRWLVDRAFPH